MPPACGPESHSVVVFHGQQLRRSADGSMQRLEMVCKPAVVQCTTAEAFLSAWKARVQEWTHPDADVVVLVLSSDSAKSLVRLGRHFALLHADSVLHHSCMLSPVGGGVVVVGAGSLGRQ